MDTATVTLHTAHNNGSFLQAYALQNTIKKMGFNNKLINFVPKAQYALYQNIIFKEISVKGIIKGSLNIPHYKELVERKGKFNRVINDLDLTEKIEDEILFPQIVREFDCIIAGSDQIWNNATMPDFSDIYLLPVEKYKISYAPSFGKSLENQFGSNILEKINDFNHLSVREKSVKRKLAHLLPDKKVEVVLDPTFLLDSSQYIELKENANCTFDGDFIFFYCIKATTDVLKTVKEIGELLNLPIVTVFTGVTSYKCQLFGQKVDFSAGPEEFLKYIENAKYVISNSFHGIVFSIIYKKIFFRVGDNDHGSIRIDERLDSILNLLGLTNQNIIAGESISLNKSIDYDEADEFLEQLKCKSLQWLEYSLKDAQKNLNYLKD